MNFRDLKPLLLFVALAGATQSLAGDVYRPIFSDELLRKADPETRARLSALNAENRRNWAMKRRDLAILRARETEERSANANANADAYSNADDSKNISVVRIDRRGPTQESLDAHQKAQREQANILEYFELKNEQTRKDRQARMDAAIARREHAENCSNWLETIQHGPFSGAEYFEDDEDGNRRYFSKAEIAAGIEQQKSLYEKDCGKIPDEDD